MVYPFNATYLVCIQWITLMYIGGTLESPSNDYSIERLITNLCGSPGLVVMGDDSCSKGSRCESWHCILDGHFFTLICCKNCIVCLKRPKINAEEAGVGLMA